MLGGARSRGLRGRGGRVVGGGGGRARTTRIGGQVEVPADGKVRMSVSVCFALLS